MEQKQILDALAHRYAVKVFDPEGEVTPEQFETIMESARLAPSSVGIEPWAFVVVTNPDLRTKIRAVSWDQSKVTDATYFVVLARRTDMRAHASSELIDRASKVYGVPPEALDGWKQMADGTVSSKDDTALHAWAAAQTYIPLGMMMETAALLGVDTCPMEGFDSAAVDEILGLSAHNLSVTTMLAIGRRGEDPAADRKKVRRAKDEVVLFMR